MSINEKQFSVSAQNVNSRFLSAFLPRTLFIGVIPLGMFTAHAQSPLQPEPRQSPPAPPGKLAPRPLFRDPPFDAPTDPVLCFNAESK